MVHVDQIGGSRESFLYNPDQVTRRLEGGLNWTTVIRPEISNQEKLLAVRRPKSALQRQETEQGIRAEYDAIGALAEGVNFRLRTLEEQKKFMDVSSSLGLRALECQALADGEMVTEFVEGISLSDYVGQDRSTIKSDVINNVLTHLTRAHSMGVVFGDRWATNTLITPNDNHVELDFDLELKGNHQTVTTFEIAQTLYHLTHFAKQNREYVADTISEIYSDQPHLLAGYDQTRMAHFLDGQRTHFYNKYQREGVEYENIIPPNEEVTNLTSTLNSIWSYVPKGPITNSLPRPAFARRPKSTE